MAQNEKKRILIVDDDPGTVFSLKEKLAKAGYSIDSVRTPNQAIARLKAGKDGPPYHLAILDLYLPNDWSTLRQSAAELDVPRTAFNQGQLLGAWIKDNYRGKIQIVYYTSDPGFFEGDRTSESVHSKLSAIDEVFEAIQALLESQQKNT